jgi:3',5'-cyclic AMP phosphodiesterase CpdA
MNEITRRESLLTVGATAVGALALGSAAFAAPGEAPKPARKRALRVAHLTDIHVEPEQRAGEGMTACLHHVQNLADKPELVITGGDSVMDCFAASDARTKVQWDLWRSVLKGECSIDVRSCIGNHDVRGWAKSKSKMTGQEPTWGKALPTEMLNLENRYYTFARGGWQFIVLDSTHPTLDGSEAYLAKLDDEQFDWLERTLRDSKPEVPIFIVSHIPLLTVTSILWTTEKTPDAGCNGWLMHSDSVKLKDLFNKHPNVKVCVSGHTHLVDRVDYNGVSYLCDGAVSGNWWRGRHRECDEGYAVIDLYDDGSFEREYVTYGWKAQA